MKTKEKYLLLAIFMLCSLLTFGQYNAESGLEEPSVTTLVSTKNIYDASELVVDLNGEVFTETWNTKERIRIEIEIKTTGLSKEVIKHLIRKRRYVFKIQQLAPLSMLLYMPNIDLPVIFNGEHLVEIISYRLKVPEGVTVRVRAGKE